MKPNGSTEKSHGRGAQRRREDSQSQLDAELVPRGVLVGGAGRLGFLSYWRTYDASTFLIKGFVIIISLCAWGPAPLKFVFGAPPPNHTRSGPWWVQLDYLAAMTSMLVGPPAETSSGTSIRAIELS